MYIQLSDPEAKRMIFELAKSKAKGILGWMSPNGFKKIVYDPDESRYRDRRKQ